MTASQMNRTSSDKPFSRNRPLQFMTFAFIVYFGWMAIAPSDRMQWFANNTPLIAVVLALAFTYRRFRFSNRSYLLLLLFFCLHVYAAHYTYETTPFDAWLKTAFHTRRSYYDRFVHLAFGLLVVYPIREFATAKMKFHSFWSYALPVVFVLAFSGLFEILEWVAASVAGQGGEAKFVGLQGDPFDTQKDMVLGLIGAIATIGMMALAAWGTRKVRQT
ncbi:DUF2238 domain-containing protein [Cohnella sp. GCM10027633]|uniref:DUF2238 domain-containing protein n=1 Tax=unclassified Cohnella TaxID=2636738 RepID=UPI003634AB91